MDMSQITQNLINKDGIWTSKTSMQIAYPADANKVYSEIEEKSFWFTHRNRVILKAIQSFSPLAKTFVDIGGGNGYTAAFLSRNGYETVLVEPGLDGIKIAKQRGVNHLINSTLQDAGFGNSLFSNVGLFDVVEHVSDDVAFLKQLNPVLREDGKVFITVPAFNWLWSQNDVNAQHYRRYTIEKFRRSAELAGFKVVYATYFFTMLPLGIFIFRSIPYRFGIRFKSLYSKALKEHKSGFASRMMGLAGDLEIAALAKKKTLSMGSSCLIVLAKK